MDSFDLLLEYSNERFNSNPLVKNWWGDLGLFKTLQIPDKIYHYTSANAISNILKDHILN